MDAAGVFHGFLRAPDGAFTTIDIPGATATALTGINDHGQMVGLYVDANGAPHVFLHDNGVVTVIDIPSAPSIFPFGINNHGQVVGYYSDDRRLHGFLLRNGVLTRLTAPPGAFRGSAAVDIDDDGRILGSYN